MGFRISSAATKNDWLSVFGAVKDGSNLAFYTMGTYDAPNPELRRIQEIPDLGVAKKGVLVLEQSFFVLLEHEKPVMRSFAKNDGAVKFNIDPNASRGFFVFRPGGLFHDSTFVIGELSSLYDSCGAVDIAKRIASYMRRRWHHENDFWIGPECHRLYGTSHHFTADYRSEYDHLQD